MKNNGTFFEGLGKRKTSVAKVFLKEGSGTIKVNSKTIFNIERKQKNP